MSNREENRVYYQPHEATPTTSNSRISRPSFITAEIPEHLGFSSSAVFSTLNSSLPVSVYSSSPTHHHAPLQLFTEPLRHSPCLYSCLIHTTYLPEARGVIKTPCMPSYTLHSAVLTAPSKPCTNMSFLPLTNSSHPGLQPTFDNQHLPSQNHLQLLSLGPKHSSRLAQYINILGDFKLPSPKKSPPQLLP